tara:strand:- start:1768 stop:5166 length:3399 start_codon:yes stop_codon:yes gene_type:complete
MTDIYAPIKLQPYKPDGIVDYKPVHLSLANNEGTADPTFGEGVLSGLKYQWLPITNATLEYYNFAFEEQDENFDFKSHMIDDNAFVYAEELARSKNKEHYDFIFNNLKALEQNRKIYDRASLGSAIVAGVVDPLNIAMFHPVFNVGFRAAWGAKSVFGVAKESAKLGFIFGAGSEILRAPFDPYATPLEVVSNVTANTLFGGIIGGGTRQMGNIFQGIRGKALAKKQQGNPVKTSENYTLEKMALDLEKKDSSQKGIAYNFFDKINIFNRIIPAWRIQQGKYNGKEVPDNIRQLHAEISYNGSVPLKQNYLGEGFQSIDQLQLILARESHVVTKNVRGIYEGAMTELTGEGKLGGTGELMGIDYRSSLIKFNRKFGNAKQTYVSNSGQLSEPPTFDEFFEEIVNIQILSGNPQWFKSYWKQVPEFKKNAVLLFEGYFRKIDQRAQDAGLMTNKTQFQLANKNILEIIQNLEKKILAEKDPIAKEVFKLALSKRRESLKFHENYVQSREGYKFPINYNIQKLQDAGVGSKYVNRLIRIFRNHYLEQGYFDRFVEGQGIVKTRLPADKKAAFAKAQSEAEKNLDTIMTTQDKVYDYRNVGKGKHLMARITNIPEWKVIDYIHKDSMVLDSYGGKMSFRIEWARKFGDEDLGSMLQGIEMQLEKLNFPDRDIAAIKSDFTADFDRVAGQMVHSPHRWDTRFTRSTKKLAGMTYLTGAGVTAGIETIAMPIMANGFGPVFKTAVRAIDGNWAKIKANANEVRNSLEGMELNLKTSQDRILHDNLRGYRSGRLENTIEGAENWFYKFNGLAPVTSIGKSFTTAVYIPKFYKQIKSYADGSISKIDEIELNQIGVDKKTATNLLKGGAWQETDTGMPLLNLEGWATNTKLQRDLKQTMQTVIATNARNTIIHATAFDRPTMMDGFVYKKWRPYMRRMGIEPDPRASVGKQADGSYRFPIARIESGVMSFPFQFYNFAFAALPRITRAMFDPAKQNRIAGMMSLLGMSYIIYKLKKPDWWFENKDTPELLMRVVDHSGVFSLYADLFYHGVNVAVGSGLHDPDTSWLKGRYKATGWDAALGLSGATPNMLREWVLSANDMLNDRSEEGMKNLSYNLPIISLIGLDDDMRALSRSNDFRY